MKLRVCERMSHNESELLVEASLRKSRVVKVSDYWKPETGRHRTVQGRTVRGGVEADGAFGRFCAGTWDRRGVTAAEVGGGHSSTETGNDRGAKGLCVRRAESETRRAD